MAKKDSSKQNGLRVAVLSDIHGNRRALEAVLAEVEKEKPDKIVIGGDVALGPFPCETIECLMALGDRALFVRGNADRELVEAFDEKLAYDPKEENPGKRLSTWSAQQINETQRNFLASFQDTVKLDVLGLGEVLFCHGSPRSDNEIITSLTPPETLEKLFQGIDDKVVVCGHTHHQFDRITDDFRVINPGSVGMPYEGQAGAYWALLGPSVQLRRTVYDVLKAAQEAEVAGYPDVEYRATLITPPAAAEVAAYFEEMAAKRGERDG
jgi:putative phosphoesterase